MKLYYPLKVYNELWDLGEITFGRKTFTLLTTSRMDIIFKDEADNVYSSNWMALKSSDNRMECYPVKLDPLSDTYVSV